MKTRFTGPKKILRVLAIMLVACVSLQAQNYNINTIAGNGTPGFSGDGGPATNAKLNSPTGVAFDNNGHILIVDHQNARIRKVDKNSGVITTIAGNGVAGFSGDGGPATAAQLNNPTFVHVVSNGHILIVDRNNARIRKIDNNGIITTIAGTGVHGFSGDGGPASFAQLNNPSGVATNSVGDIFIADQGNSRVRMIDHLNGNIRTFAGSGLFGFLGDGGLASLAILNSPSGVAVDNNGHVLIVDHFNARIRKVDKNTGIITTIVGNGIIGFGGDGGLATLANLNSPSHVFVHSNNHLHIVDQMNMRIRKVDANTGVITTIVGNGIAGFAGDGGDALMAQLNSPICADIDVNDVIVIADMLNHRIRQCIPSVCISPSISVPPVSIAVCEGSPAVFAVTALGDNLNYQWEVDEGTGVFVNVVNGGAYSGATTASLNINTNMTHNGHRYRCRVSNPCGVTVSASATLTVKAKPVIQFSAAGMMCAETTICAGSSVTVTASGASTFVWSTGSTSASITVSPNVNTTYSVVGTTNGCATTASFTVNVNAAPNVSVTANPTSVCPGSPSTLTASGASTYLWTTGETTASIVVRPTATTTYSVTGTAANGCAAVASATVNVKSAPNVTVTASPAVICVGGTSTLSASGASSYTWSTGQTGANITVSPTTTTTYSVTGTKNGCSTTALVTVFVNGSVSVSASASPAIICAGESTTLMAVGASTYTWSTGQTGATIIVSPAATTTYTVTGTNSSGCSATASVQVTVKAKPVVTVSASPSIICPGSSSTLTATGASSFVWSTGQTGASIIVSPSATTTYTVTGTTNGCSTTASVIVTVSGSISISASASPPIICQGESATLTATGASSYTWSTGQTGASIVVSPNATTTYTVTGTSASGCSASTNVTLTVKAKPIVTVSASPSVICPGGSATLTASGAGSFIWSTGQTGASITVSPTVTTTYSVTGTTNGCSTTASVTVTVSGPIIVAATASPSLICVGASSTLTATGASSYVWSTGQTGSSIVVNSTATTTYTVTGTNASGCSGSASVTVFVNPLPSVTVTASPATICVGASSTLTASGTGSFLWNTGQTSASIVVSPTATTTYTVTKTLNGCSASASVTVFVNGSISVAASASPAVICPGASSTLTATGAASYTWSTGQTGATIVVNPNTTTTYTVTGTNASGCTGVASVTVNVSGPIAVAATASPSLICVGASSTLTATGASSYVWSTGQTGSSIVVNPTATTMYTVTGTNASGCSGSASVTVFVNPIPSISASASPSVICAGASATLMASGSGSFLWSTGQTSASIVVSPSVTTTYTVTTTLNGCSASASATVFVTGSISVAASASPAVICPGTSSTLTATGATSYVWNTGQTGATIIVNPNSTTTYTVTGTNASGCTGVASVTVAVNAAPNITVSASPATICVGSFSTLTASGAGSFVWSTGQTGASIVVNPTATTTYSVTGTSNGCSSTASVTVFVNGAISVNASASPSVICAGGASTLIATGANSYVWSTGQTGASIVVNPGVTTTYTVTGSLNGCSASASVTVFVSGSVNVAASASPSTICAGSFSTLTATGAGSYTWSTGQTGASIVVNPMVTTTYTVTGFLNGCSGTASVTVFVGGSIAVSATASPATICAGSSSTLFASGADTFTWSTGQTGSSIVVTPASTTTYTVTGFRNGCSGTASVTVFVNPKPPVTCTASPSIITLGLTSTLTASGAVSYQWSTGATGSSIIVIPLLTSTYSVVGTGANGCSNTASVTVTVNLLGGIGLRTASDPSSDATQTTEESVISAYPNPTSGTYFIKDVPENSSVEIYDLRGMRMHQSTVTEPNLELDLSQYPAGMYLVKVFSNNKVIYHTRVLRK